MQGILNHQTLAILFLASPALFAAVVAFAKPQAVLVWVDAFDLWVMTTQPTYVGKAGYIKRIFYKPVLWAFQMIGPWTQSIKDDFVRCGVRAASYLYIAAISFGVMTYLTFLAIMSLLMIIAVIAGLFLVLVILGALLVVGKQQGRP